MAKRDIHQEVTDTIIAHLEGGTVPWHKDWTGTRPAFVMPRRANGEFYKGINVLMLWIAAEDRGYTADTWMTFKQAKSIGANVRKGERGTGIVHYGTFEKDNDQGKPEVIPFLKRYTVFNVQQIENLPCDLTPDLFDGEEDDHGHEKDTALEAFFTGTGAAILNDGANPCYRPATDTIHMPRIGQFETVAGYYGTLSHELVHWTGHKSRLDRLNTINKEGYAFEELIAELGSCFLTARLGGEFDDQNAAAYIGSWLKALRNDKRYIFKAAAAAQKAADYALGLANANTGHAIAAE